MPPIQDHDSRRLLLRGPSLGLRLAVLVVAAVTLMVADQRQGYLSVLRGWLSAAVYPLHWAVDAPFSGWQAATSALAMRSTLEADNTVLAAENLRLKLRLMRFEALEEENRRLRAAREGSARVVQRSLVAEILKVDLDPRRHRVLVDRGTRDGVFKGQAALDASGVFGQVTRVGPVSAEIIMVSDPAHAIPVQINRTGVRSIAVGLGRTDALSLPYLPRNADVQPDDLVVTSGLGGVFPPGYPVATIARIDRDPGAQLLAVTAAPLAELDRDPEVLLVWFDNLIVEPEPEAEPTPQPAAATPPAPAPAAGAGGPGATEAGPAAGTTTGGETAAPPAAPPAGED